MDRKKGVLYLVLDWLLVLGYPVEGWESSDVVAGGHVVGSGVHLHDLDILTGHLLAKFVVNWGELFAVAAPWGVELDEDVLLAVGDEGLEVLGNSNLKINKF